MNFKKILVLVLTLAMLIGTFMPTLSVFAEELNEGEHNHESTEKHYVSIGDSMTNGYGFEGYEQGTTNRENYMSIDRFLTGDGVYGEGSYALQFEEYLKGIYGDENVDHTKLAVSALRAEDLLYLLGGRDEPADDWFNEFVYYSTGAAANKHLVPQLAAHYQNAVKDADIITLGVGNASFGAFMLSRITSALGVMGGSLNEEQVAMYKLENALALLDREEDKEFLLNLYNNLFDTLNGFVDDETATTYKLQTVCDIFAYITASFIVNYTKSIDKIVEVNEKENLEIILVGLMNTTYGMEITLGDDASIPFGDIMDEMFGLLNAYIAGYPATKQVAGEFKGVKFYYAEQPNPDFIVNAFDDLDANNWENVDNDRLSAMIVRDRTITTYNETLRYMIGMGFVAGINAGINATVLGNYRDGFGVSPEMMSDDEFIELLKATPYPDATFATYYDEYAYAIEVRVLAEDFDLLPVITLSDVQAYEANTPDSWNNEYFWADATDRKNLSIAIYLALEDAIVESVAVDHIPLEGLQTIAGDLMSVFSGFTPSITSPVAVYNDLLTFFTSDSLLPLVKIFGLFQIGNGMSVHPTPTGHDNLTNVIIEAYETDWTVQKQTLKDAYDYIVKYYDEAYEIGYYVADMYGYIDVSVEAINEAISALYVAIDEVNAGTLGVTEELKEKLVAELEATIETLEELRDVLANDSAKDVEGLVAAVFALENDLYAHLNGVYAVLEQAGIDVNQLVLVPAFNEAVRVINEEVIPTALAAAEAFANAVVEYVQAKLDALYTKVVGISKEVYNQIIDTIVRIQLHVGEKVDNAIAPVVDAYLTILGTLTDIYGSVDEAVRVAGETLKGIIDTITYINDKLENGIVDTLKNVVNAYVSLVNTLYETYGSIEEALKAAEAILGDIVNTVDGTIADALELYEKLVNVLANTYDTIENVAIVAGQIFSYVYDFAVEYLTPEQMEEYLNDITNIVTETYRTTKDVYYTVSQVYAYLEGKFSKTFEGNYVVTSNSLYVALGNDTYGSELAEMLKLSDEQYYNFDLSEDYLDMVSKADLVTIKLDNGETIKFALSQIQNIGKPLDWDKYLDAEGQEALNAALESLETSLLENGQADQLTSALQVVLENMNMPAVTLTNDKAVEIISYTVESALYAYAEFVDRALVTIDNVHTVAPNATVVITGVNNPVADVLANLGEGLAQYAKAFDLVFDGINVQLMAVAFVNDNTIFVDSEDAEDIFNALNVVFHQDPVEPPKPENPCNHVYENCCFDSVCKLCGETRKAGHSFSEYVVVEEATCSHPAIEEAKCDNCGATSRREVPDTQLEHVFGEWEVLIEATLDDPGKQVRHCTICGFEETKSIPMLAPEPITTGPVPVIIIGAVIVLAIVLAKVIPMIKNKKSSSKKSSKKSNNKKK